MATSSYCTFYIVRHGQTEWNVKRILQGHRDSPLTSDGVAEAKKLARLFKNITFAEVFSSDLLRAKRTAEIMAVEHQLIVKTSQLLREVNLGRFQGRAVAEFRRELKDLIATQETLSDEERFTFRLDETIETNEELMTRFITFLREVAVAYLGKKVLVVTHGGMIRTLLVHLGYGTFKTLEHGAVKNLGYIKLDSDGVDFFVRETKGVEKVDSK